jgi:hypothetical protein
MERPPPISDIPFRAVTTPRHRLRGRQQACGGHARENRSPGAGESVHARRTFELRPSLVGGEGYGCDSAMIVVNWNCETSANAKFRGFLKQCALMRAVDPSV